MCGCSCECAIFASVSLHISHMHERNWLIIGHTRCGAAGYQSRLGILKTGPHLISWCICNLEFMTADLSLTISSPKNIVWGTLLDITGQLLNYILPMCMLCIVFFIACHEFNLQKVLYKEILFTTVQFMLLDWWTALLRFMIFLVVQTQVQEQSVRNRK